VNRLARSHSVTIQAAAKMRMRAIPLPFPHQHYREPAEPGRHRRLIGESGRDPVQPERELPEAEPPPPRERGAQRRRSLDQPKQGGEGEDGERPKPQRREAERAGEPGEEGEGEWLHRWAVWGLAAGAVNGRRRAGGG